jgi:hypothetical protein
MNFQANLASFVKDTSQHEGISVIEMLAQILAELMVLNLQIHELPINIGATSYNNADDVEDIRAEMFASNYNH